MHLTFRNCNDAFEGLVRGIDSGDIPTIQTPSRNGPVIQIPEPVTITYTHPRERVLFNPARDANPFFHLFESLWMLAGRNDIAPLTFYAKQIAEYSDDGETMNGAYGYRWRKAPGKPALMPNNAIYIQAADQLITLADHLRQNPNSRRAVLQMWSVGDDLLKMDTSKDVCCNLSVMFAVRQESAGIIGGQGLEDADRPYLDMTVTNRSNDLIWGALGANVVHFSFLQEYMAARIGVGVGVYHHFTNNLHVYTETNSGWQPDKWLPKSRTMHDPKPLAYGPTFPQPYPLVMDAERFDREVVEFIDDPVRNWTEPFLADVAAPMCLAFKAHKLREYDAAESYLDQVSGADWREAGRAWIARRKAAWEKKHGA